MALSVRTAAGFDKTVVQRKVMANAISPPSAFVPEVRIMAEDVVVDITQDKFFFW